MYNLVSAQKLIIPFVIHYCMYMYIPVQDARFTIFDSDFQVRLTVVD